MIRLTSTQTIDLLNVVLLFTKYSIRYYLIELPNRITEIYTNKSHSDYDLNTQSDEIQI